MKEIFLLFAPYIVLVFIIAMPPEIFRNFKTKTYSSGTRSSWLLRILGYSIFGFYSLIIHEYVVALAQIISLCLSLCIIIQSYMYRHAK